MHKATISHHKTDFVRARIEPKLKEEVNAFLHAIGVTPTQVITMLYKQIQHKHALPFDLSIPNLETAKAIKEARTRKGIVRSKNTKEMFKKLGISDA